MNTIQPTCRRRGRPPKNLALTENVQAAKIKKDLFVCFKISYNYYTKYINSLKVEQVVSSKEDNQLPTLISLDPTITKQIHDLDIKVKMDKINSPFEETDNIIINKPTKLRCLWDHCKINDQPYFLPTKYHNGIFYAQKWFCSLNCACAYNLNSHDTNISEKNSLLKFMYNYPKQIEPAPSILKLDKYGGELSIEEYRKKYCQDKVKIMENKVQFDKD